MDDRCTSVSSQLYRTIHAGSFFNINDEDLFKQIHDDFSEELDSAYSIRDPGATLPSTPSPSRVLYGLSTMR
jgi:hypothetical protein